MILCLFSLESADLVPCKKPERYSLGFSFSSKILVDGESNNSIKIQKKLSIPFVFLLNY